MKMFFFIFSLILFSFFLIENSFSQNKKNNYNNEIGIGFSYLPFTIFKNPFIADINFSNKLNINRNIIRTGIDFKTFANDFTINIGYERNIGKNKLKFIYGLDICMLYQERKFFSPSYKIEKFYHYGFGPIIGLCWRPFNKISFQTETGMFWGYGFENDFDGTIWSYNFAGSFFTIHRLISLNIYYRF